jgi:type I restriction enzyme S subunit
MSNKILNKDWAERKLGEVCFTTSGGTPSRRNKSYYEGKIPWVKSGELNNNIILDSEEHITEEALKKSSAKIFPKGTLLFALYGATIGKMATLGIEAASNQAVCGIYKSDIFNSRYLYNYLFFQKNYLIRQGIGGAQPNISQTILKKLNIPIAPLVEQQAIVKKLDEFFSSLDSGIADLKKAQDQLVIYRQAVLKKAFEGELTKEWRVKQTNLPISEELLKQIKEERQNHYETQVINWKKAVEEWEKSDKTGKKPSRISKPKEFPDVKLEEIENYDSIPKSWFWTRFGTITYKIGDIDHKMPKTVEKGMPYVSTGNIGKNGKIDFDSAKQISRENFDRLALKIKPERGDIIFPRYGTIGRNILIDYDKEFLVSYSCAIIKNITKVMDERFALYYSLSPVIKREINRYVVDTTQANIGIASIESFVYPLCSKQEQRQIVQEIESRLSVCDAVEKNINESLQKAIALRQSILKKAFEGSLLSVEEIANCKADATYEPASILLEKIRVEKLAKETITKKPKKKTTKKKPPAPQKISTDIQAGVISKVIQLHKDNPKYLDNLTHVKCEKISHLVEYHLQIPLGRVPVKDAAGPDDYNHLKKVEHRANMAGYFKVVKKEIGHTYSASRNITKAIDNLENKVTKEQKKQLDNLINLFLKFDLERAEIIATLYAGWNNLIIDGKTPTDDEIVYESRENWSKRKLTIDRERFYKAIQWMRKDEINLIPIGFGSKVLKPKKRK